MSIGTFLLWFVITITHIVQSDRASSSLVHNVLTTDELHIDPFEDPYLRTVLRMDSKTLMEIPMLDDATFISQLNESNDDRNILGDHCHVIEPEKNKIRIFKQVLKERVINESTPIPKIYGEELAKMMLTLATIAILPSQREMSM
ncbi:unnamed protein product [Rotaria sordida]|uniref:Uncharacterized protein n=1 Tax=Rotaria sordida TaxID=392033 RepID=A0A815AD02_9BILA|nr:unnamed protein product [Rotaria sordida]CAF1275602.1 unnamed protein product [Rotaria sordida]